MKNKYRMITKIVRNMKFKKNERNDMNDNEMEALRYIIKHPGCISNDIVLFLSVDKGLVTRIIKRLKENNYILLNEGVDRRKKHLFPTNKSLAEKIDTQNFEIKYYKELFKEIPEVEQDEFFKTLEKLYLKSKAIREANNEKI